MKISIMDRIFYKIIKRKLDNPNTLTELRKSNTDYSDKGAFLDETTFNTIYDEEIDNFAITYQKTINYETYESIDLNYTPVYLCLKNNKLVFSCDRNTSFIAVPYTYIFGHRKRYKSQEYKKLNEESKFLSDTFKELVADKCKNHLIYVNPLSIYIREPDI